ncbi:hypothetical protein AAFF_G00171800 [Aldrovandia affinis]|uniref:Uncharacterized protein n=1 Tax=Aldrovandia affinis TaxID=143900 RepID=A0AAD7SYL4_9TELE|nr:hypothetical protein AAFF_G00171800 [Aldrovandia affinis]
MQSFGDRGASPARPRPGDGSGACGSGLREPGILQRWGKDGLSGFPLPFPDIWWMSSVAFQSASGDYVGIIKGDVWMTGMPLDRNSCWNSQKVEYQLPGILVCKEGLSLRLCACVDGGNLGADTQWQSTLLAFTHVAL